MTKQEFIQRLKEELESGLRASEVQEQIRYYSQYIEDEVRKGREEQKVVAELGDPWAIAKTILDMSENEEYVHESGAQQPEAEADASSPNKSRFLIILGLVGICMLLVAVLSGLIAFVVRFFVPIVIAVLVYQAFRKIRW